MPTGVYARPSLTERFWGKVNKAGENECWIWAGAKDPHGYGQMRVDDRVIGAHRVSYEINVGPMPHDLVIDHICRNPSCVNPRHLEAVTMAENTQRGILYAIRRIKKNLRNYCARGHEFSPENTQMLQSGHRSCKACQRMKANEWRRNNRARVNELQQKRRMEANG